MELVSNKHDVLQVEECYFVLPVQKEESRTDSIALFKMNGYSDTAMSLRIRGYVNYVQGSSATISKATLILILQNKLYRHLSPLQIISDLSEFLNNDKTEDMEKLRRMESVPILTSKKPVTRERKCRHCNTHASICKLVHWFMCQSCKKWNCTSCGQIVSEEQFHDHYYDHFYNCQPYDTHLINFSSVHPSTCTYFSDWNQWNYVIIPCFPDKCMIGKRISPLAFTCNRKKYYIHPRQAHRCVFESKPRTEFDVTEIVTNRLLRCVSWDNLKTALTKSFGTFFGDGIIGPNFSFGIGFQTDFACDICMEDYPKKEIRRCSFQKHAFCKDCLAKSILSKDMDSARNCIEKKCQGLLNIQGLPQLSAQWYDSFALGPIRNELQECAWCHISSYASKEELRSMTFFICPYCFEKTCNLCKFPFHGENTPCKIQYLDEFKEACSCLNMTQCPKCKKLHEIVPDLCNKLICTKCCPESPMTIFCACCSNAFDSDHAIYSHFCRTFEHDDTSKCVKKDCRHCYLWTSQKAANNANPDFLEDYPQFRPKDSVCATCGRDREHCHFFDHTVKVPQKIEQQMDMALDIQPPEQRLTMCKLLEQKSEDKVTLNFLKKLIPKAFLCAACGLDKEHCPGHRMLRQRHQNIPLAQEMPIEFDLTSDADVQFKTIPMPFDDSADIDVSVTIPKSSLGRWLEGPFIGEIDSRYLR